MSCIYCRRLARGASLRLRPEVTQQQERAYVNKPEPTPDTLRTIPEAQAALKVSRGFIYTLRDRGALEFVKLGRAARIRQSSIDRLIQAGAAK